MWPGINTPQQNVTLSRINDNTPTHLKYCNCRPALKMSDGTSACLYHAHCMCCTVCGANDTCKVNIPDLVASLHSDPLRDRPVLLLLLSKKAFDPERLVGRLKCTESHLQSWTNQHAFPLTLGWEAFQVALTTRYTAKLCKSCHPWCYSNGKAIYVKNKTLLLPPPGNLNLRWFNHSGHCNTLIVKRHRVQSRDLIKMFNTGTQ